MKPFHFLLAILIIVISCAIQACKPEEKFTCIHRNLSKDFDFKVLAKHFLLEDGVEYSLGVNIIVINKHTGTNYDIHLGSKCFFEGTYTNCNHVRSYITGVNKYAEIADNDFGDIVVADLNFDGKDDFALKKNRGGNSGPDYAFYVQDEKGAFAEDTFLNNIGFFPDEFVPKTKTLIFGVRANTYQYQETVYLYKPALKQWFIVIRAIRNL